MAEHMTDWDILSAYLDGELSETEQQALLVRLQTDPVLATNLAELRVVTESLKHMLILKAPRNYTLDPAVYGKKSQVLGWRIGLSLAAAMLILLVGVGVLLQRGEMADQARDGVGMSEPLDEGSLFRPQESPTALPPSTFMATDNLPALAPNSDLRESEVQAQEEDFSMAAEASSPPDAGRENERFSFLRAFLETYFDRLFRFLGELDD